MPIGLVVVGLVVVGLVVVGRPARPPRQLLDAEHPLLQHDPLEREAVGVHGRELVVEPACEQSIHVGRHGDEDVAHGREKQLRRLAEDADQLVGQQEQRAGPAHPRLEHARGHAVEPLLDQVTRLDALHTRSQVGERLRHDDVPAHLPLGQQPLAHQQERGADVDPHPHGDPRRQRHKERRPRLRRERPAPRQDRDHQVRDLVPPHVRRQPAHRPQDGLLARLHNPVAEVHRVIALAGLAAAVLPSSLSLVHATRLPTATQRAPIPHFARTHRALIAHSSLALSAVRRHASFCCGRGAAPAVAGAQPPLWPGRPRPRPRRLGVRGARVGWRSAAPRVECLPVAAGWRPLCGARTRAGWHPTRGQAGGPCVGPQPTARGETGVGGPTQRPIRGVPAHNGALGPRWCGVWPHVGWHPTGRPVGGPSAGWEPTSGGRTGP